MHEARTTVESGMGVGAVDSRERTERCRRCADRQQGGWQFYRPLPALASVRRRTLRCGTADAGGIPAWVLICAGNLPRPPGKSPGPPPDMDYSVTFARHFSRLVWLLLHESGNIDEQKAALRAVVTVCKDGPVTLATQDWRLVVNGAALPEALTGVQDLAAQLIGHAVRDIRVDQGAAAADLLGIARILAAEPIPGDGGRAVEQKLSAMGAATVHVAVQGAEVVSRRTGAMEAISAEPAPAPADPAPAPPAPAAPGRSDIITEETSGHFLAFSAVQTPKGSAGEILAQLDATRSVNLATRLLDELVTVAENAGREGRIEDVARAFHGVVSREATISEPDLKRAYVMALRRMSKPTLLRPVAMLLPRRRDELEDYLAVLARAGEDGAEALIEQLTAAQSLSDRRIYFDCLVRLNAGVPALVHMLGDARWYVARNAADLLGEMQVPEAETPLAQLLKHDDDRVRRAATTALAKLGTPRAVQALRDALRDTSPQVRMQAAAGLAARKGVKSASTLAKALDTEPDVEVQLMILSSLGRVATGEAVSKLARAAEPEGRLFKKKPAAYRMAAITALGEANTPAARAALDALRNDKDKDVRELAYRVLLQTAREADSKA